METCYKLVRVRNGYFSYMINSGRFCIKYELGKIVDPIDGLYPLVFDTRENLMRFVTYVQPGKAAILLCEASKLQKPGPMLYVSFLICEEQKLSIGEHFPPGTYSAVGLRPMAVLKEHQ